MASDGGGLCCRCPVRARVGRQRDGGPGTGIDGPGRVCRGAVASGTADRGASDEPGGGFSGGTRGPEDRTRVRLELARAFFLRGEDALANAQFESVLAGDLPPSVVSNVRRFLNTIGARKRWEAYLGLGLSSDSNIGDVR